MLHLKLENMKLMSHIPALTTQCLSNIHFSKNDLIHHLNTLNVRKETHSFSSRSD